MRFSGLAARSGLFCSIMQRACFLNGTTQHEANERFLRHQIDRKCETHGSATRPHSDRLPRPETHDPDTRTFTIYIWNRIKTDSLYQDYRLLSSRTRFEVLAKRTGVEYDYGSRANSRQTDASVLPTWSRFTDATYSESITQVK